MTPSVGDGQPSTWTTHWEAHNRSVLSLYPPMSCSYTQDGYLWAEVSRPPQERSLRQLPLTGDWGEFSVLSTKWGEVSLLERTPSQWLNGTSLDIHTHRG